MIHNVSYNVLVQYKGGDLMTANEYLEIVQQKNNDRVCELIKFLQDNGYDYSEFDLGVIVGREIRCGALNCRTPTQNDV